MPDTDTHAAGVVVGVLALQGAFVEHATLLQRAAAALLAEDPLTPAVNFDFVLVRTAEQLACCHALVIPGGESTSISLIAERTGLLLPLRRFVKIHRRPVWGTCAGLILLAEEANRSKASGQELIGGLDVRVHRNYFGRQVESFEADLDLPFLGPAAGTFHSVFIRAPVVEQVLLPLTGRIIDDPTAAGAKSSSSALLSSSSSSSSSSQPPPPTSSPAQSVSAPPMQHTSAAVEILARLPGRARAIRQPTATAQDLGEDGDIVAVRQGNVFGTAFHPELTNDARIHAWWLKEVLRWKDAQASATSAAAAS